MVQTINSWPTVLLKVPYLRVQSLFFHWHHNVYFNPGLFSLGVLSLRTDAQKWEGEMKNVSSPINLLFLLLFRCNSWSMSHARVSCCFYVCWATAPYRTSRITARTQLLGTANTSLMSRDPSKSKQRTEWLFTPVPPTNSSPGSSQTVAEWVKSRFSTRGIVCFAAIVWAVTQSGLSDNRRHVSEAKFAALFLFRYICHRLPFFPNIFRSIHWNGKRSRRQRNDQPNILLAESTQS